MTTEANTPEVIPSQAEAPATTKRRPRLLLLALLLLLAILMSVVLLMISYVRRPRPLPEILPLPVTLNYPPHYLFSIQEVVAPVGVAVSPGGDRIYASEMGGERLVKIFDRRGTLLGSFSPPRTKASERAPVYLATDRQGRVFVTDRLQHAIYVFDRGGNYIDEFLNPKATLSEYVKEQTGARALPSTIAYNTFESKVHYQVTGETAQTLPPPRLSDWAPLGIRIDHADNMLVTDVVGQQHTVRKFAGGIVSRAHWHDFDPPDDYFGGYGKEAGQFLFPNIAVSDSQGRIYVTDGNNGRITVWSKNGSFDFSFGRGGGRGAVSLPRGAAIDEHSRLYVVDAVGQDVKVYDVSGPQPAFLFAFGDWGGEDGQFNYPNDIALDATGRLYITDRENHRVQVWSY
jgi:DNA-binding beta-propeller fold protein YncE